MKKIVSFLVGIAAASALLAKPVDPATARIVASNILSGAEIEDCSYKLPFDEMYLFCGADGHGFVVVSADDCAVPVVGYSATSVFSTDAKAAMDWLAAGAMQIADLRNRGVAQSDYVADQWEKALAGQSRKDGNDAVPPLLTTTWNQSPYYNTQCPYDNSHYTRAVAGCGAIAMAQVMKYWNYPATGYGYHEYVHPSYGTLTADFGNTSYQWSLMPDDLNGTSSAEQVNAVATLVYHAGVSIDMQYSSGNSWSYLFYYGHYGVCIETALPTYFGYSSDVHAVLMDEYSNAEWQSLLLGELQANRPIIYRGANIEDNNGHIFVCDGYDGEGRFHFNWGWGGYADGYFAIGSLNADDYNDYSFGNSAVVGIHPAAAVGSTVSVSGVPNNPDWGSVSGSTTTPFMSGNVVELSASAWNGYRFQSWADGCIDNPRYRHACEDVSDTAVFVPINPDTVSFGSDRLYRSFNIGVGLDVHWGIRIDRPLLSPAKRLSAVQFYVGSALEGELLVYNKGGLAPDSLIYSQQFNYGNIGGWVTIRLDSLLGYDATKPLWVTLRTPDTYMVPYSRYCGASDGTWIRGSNARWSVTNRSLLLHAIFATPTSGIAEHESPTAPVVHIDGRGLTVDVHAADTPVEVYDIYGRRMAQAHGSCRVQLPSAGIYVVVAGGASRKVAAY